ncbi:MAG: beta strand repeat-containing protein, partial [Bacteroidota bacterium]
MNPAYGQTDDTLCVSNPVGTYYVQGFAGSTFNWNANGNGNIISGQGNDTVFISWNQIPGTYNLTVIETTSSGCIGIPVLLNIFITDVDSTFATQTTCNPANVGIVSSTYQNVSGCDSVHTITTTLLLSDSTFETQTTCNPANVGVVSTTYQNVSGCDSVHTITTTLLLSDSTFATQTTCNPANVGVVSNTYQNVSGCDSVHTITTTLLLSDSTFATQTTCNPANVGVVSNTYQNVSGCDSVHTVTTTLFPSLNTIVNAQICLSQNYTLPDGTVVNTANTYTSVLTSVSGCDSIITTNLTVNNQVTSTTDITICDSQLPYNWNGNDYNATGVYDVTLTSAANCDSIATLNLTVNNTLTSTTNTTICDNQLPYNWNGNDYNAQGNYTVTLTNASGCDSIATLNLTINNTLTGTDVQTHCNSYTWIDGNTYTTSTNTPTFTITLPNGCDSIVTLDLTINNTLSGTDVQTHCNSYTWIDGNTYTSSTNTPTFTITLPNGCDSIVTLDLTINNTLSGTDVQTHCNSYTWIDGNTYTSSTNTPTFTITLPNGCDSIVTLDLTINDILTSTTDITICDNQLPYNWNGNDYNATGVYDVTLTSAANCDSVATLNLTVNNSITSTIDITICDSQLPYSWNGNDYNAAGVYNVTLTSAANCDSVATLNLTVNNSITSTTDITICDSQLPYSWNGNNYNAAGTYDVTLTSAANCDSIATLNLTINDVLTTDINTQICTGQSYILPDGSTTGTTGVYTFTLTSSAGCDSIVTVNLQVNDVLTSTTDITICDNQLPYNWNGTNYNAAGVYNVTLTSAANCDSVATLNLAISNTLTGTDVQSHCNSYTWIDGITYTSSTNTPTFTITLPNGCDSIVTLDLTINNFVTGTDVQTHCTSYTWIDGITYSASTNTPTYTIVGGSATGCDSIVTLDLTINNTLTGTDVQTHCNTYIWIDGNTYTSSTNTPTFTITLLNGCDSIVTLDLTINDILTSTTDITICDNQLPYSWNGNNYNAAGTYNVTLTSAANCDSVATLNLTINNMLSGADVQTHCNTYTWIDGNTYTTSTNTPTFTITLANGCDSIVTLDLTINNFVTGTDVQTHCTSYTWIDGVTYSASTNTPTFTITLPNGCDSIVTLDLTINNTLTGTDVQTHCNTYTWIDGNTYTSSTNTPTFTITLPNGCDSIVTLDLTINNTLSGTDVQTHCNSYTWIDGNTYTSSTNTPTFTITLPNGCDSIVTLDLTINNTLTGTDVQTHCNTYTWIDGNTYTSSTNTPTFTITLPNGCDSIVTLDLTINNTLTGTDVQTHCNSYTWIDGNTYTTSTNTPTFTITLPNDCDSIVTLDLTINNTLTGTDVQTHCNTYTWIDGNTYTTSTNTPTFTITLPNGCDSIVTLDLTINNTLSGTDVQTHCNTYTWIDGNTYTTSTNTPTFTITLPNGCDSIVTLDLTINNTLTGTDIQTHCNSYTWIDGNTYTSSTNTPTFTITLPNGCDSIVTLDLTINNFVAGTDVQTHCTSYTWIDGVTYSASTNTPTYTIVGGSATGCDSIVALDLTINNTLTGTDVQTHCNTYTWIDGNTYTSSTNTPTFTITLPNGCDSIVTLDLTINNTLTGTDIQTHCNSYTWIDGNTYTTSTNTPTFTITLPNGCDSIVTLDLTINNTLTGTDVQTHCNTYT